MNGTAFVEEARKTLEKLLTRLQPAPVEGDRFPLLSVPERVWQTSETAGKSDKQIERCVIATFQVAESMGSFASGSTCCGLAIENCGPLQHLLRVGDLEYAGRLGP